MRPAVSCFGRNCLRFFVPPGAPLRAGYWRGQAMMSWGEMVVRGGWRHGRHFAGAVLVTALAGCAALNQAQAPSLDTIAESMPAQLAGFTLGETARRPGPSLAFDYATPNRSAVGSVLVFDGAARVPNDPADPAIDRELTTAVMELSEAPQGRTGRRLAERDRATLAELGLRCAVLTGAFGRAAVIRHVCIGGADGRFVKVQVTMADSRPPPADARAFAAAALQGVRNAGAARP